MNVPSWAKNWTQDGWASMNAFDNERLEVLLVALADVRSDIEEYRSLSVVERREPTGTELATAIRHKVPSLLYL